MKSIDNNYQKELVTMLIKGALSAKIVFLLPIKTSRYD